MAKYHINSKGEVRQCRANIQCRFGGSSGKENHFDSKQEAEVIQQERFTKLYPHMEGVTKASLKEKQIRTCEILTDLKDRGLRVKKVVSVANHNFARGTDHNVSNIDVLDEKPSEEFLKNLRSGDVKTF